MAHTSGSKLLGIALVLSFCAWLGAAEGAPRVDSTQVRTTIKLVADQAMTHPAPFGPTHWAMAPLYDGLIDTSLVTDDPRYLAAVIRVGRLVLWQPGPQVYHADAHAAGHAWLRIYLMNPNRQPGTIEPLIKRFDEILSKPIRDPLSFSAEPRRPGVDPTDRWTWADALYMAPPTLTLLSQATGDRRYLQFVDAEFKAAYDALFDSQENLFYRDARFIGMRTPNGEKVFWSRGNAWVYAGLARMLSELPTDWPTRPFYTKLFMRMSPAVLASQQSDGHWYPSLKDPQHVPIGETSGSALFLFGFAWGVRNGLLDRATYWPSVERGWNAVLTRIGPAGTVNFVQPIGAGPEIFDPASRQSYGTGAVLIAGSEILRALGGASTVSPSRLIVETDVVRAPDLSGPTDDAATASPRYPPMSGPEERAFSVRTLTAIAAPVLEALSKSELKQRMPVHDGEQHRAAWTHYEAFARTLAGIAPWLALGPDDSAEGRERARFIELARQSVINATDPQSRDYMNFGQIPDQPLVESAYLSYALLTAPRQLWDPLNAVQRKQLLDALKISRAIELKHNNNWVLFPAMIDAALWRLQGHADASTIERAVRQIEAWYVGDGLYGDGPTFKWDYYNSFVIQPMLLEILRVAAGKHHPLGGGLSIALERAQRYAEIQERLISPEGTFPVIGRSQAYRFGAFFHLAYMALHKELPPAVKPAAVRGAITTVMRRMVEAPGFFDERGWLTLGVVGHQPGVSEMYNATGSLYICLLGLVHLGLPADDPFWTAAPAQWTQQLIWSGKDVARDQSLEGRKGN
jgi:rhamnogalacturonyl hydrolase YesR